MTYCVAMSLDEGMLFASDSRTNAGLDHVSSFCKMTVFEQTGQGVLVLLNSGNLATTQQVVSRLKAHAKHTDTPLTAKHLRAVVSRTQEESMGQTDVDFCATFLLGGQLRGEEPRLFLVYPQGNFIETTADTAFFQIGESKYGKPILDRVVQPALPLYEAVKCALVSFDSTIKSNLSVGLPIDLALVRRDQFAVAMRHRIDADDAYFRQLRTDWSQGLRRVFNELPEPGWLR